ncbi:hypothetical protein Tco_1259902, partial [Tanacetum coccineum]
KTSSEDIVVAAADGGGVGDLHLMRNALADSDGEGDAGDDLLRDGPDGGDDSVDDDPDDDDDVNDDDLDDDGDDDPDDDDGDPYSDGGGATIH